MDDSLSLDLAAWQRQPAPRLLLVESQPGASARRRVARTLENAIWLRPQPGGGEAGLEGLLEDLTRVATGEPRHEAPANEESGTTGAARSAIRTDRTPRGPPTSGWARVWDAWRGHALDGVERTWVFDARDGLPAAAWEEIARVWAGVRGQALPVRLILLTGPDSMGRLAELPHDRIVATPTPALSWTETLANWSAEDRILGAAIFGGEDRFRTLVDPSRSLGRNVRTLILAPDAPLATAALDRVRHAVQRPERYVRVTRAVATGATDWGAIRRSVGGLAGSGQLGPYVRTLEEIGVLRSSRSLDASPRSRSARYRMADPWLGFFFSCVLPSWSRLGTGDPGALWRGEVRPRLDGHLERTLPRLVAEWLHSVAARERLGSSAREVGGLWGDGYDMPVAGTLESGAVAYGWTRWTGHSFTESEISAASGQLRSTRYGFGRETRLKLFVQRGPVAHEVARLVARDPEIHVLSVPDLR